MNYVLLMVAVLVGAVMCHDDGTERAEKNARDLERWKAEEVAK